VSDWIKARGPGQPWHLRGLGSAGSACTERFEDRDIIGWTDPDTYPPGPECCGPCQSIFSGASVERRDRAAASSVVQMRRR
jgi:hypothetical protein